MHRSAPGSPEYCGFLSEQARSWKGANNVHLYKCVVYGRGWCRLSGVQFPGRPRINRREPQNDKIMETIIYNGKTLEQIKSNFPPNMPEIHRVQYINNCIEVFRNESEGINLGYCQAVMNTNFLIISIYNNLDQY